MKIKKDKLPIHIGFIMDGNGRWATRRGLPRKMGHKKGADVLEKIVDYCFEVGIKYVTCFAFSTENWKRPQEEIDYIFGLLRDYIKKQNEKNASSGNNELKQRNIKICVLGDISKIPEDLQKELEKIEKDTDNCDAFVLNIAMNYGGRDDIVNAVNTLIASGKTKVNEQDISNALYTKGMPDPDFIIRTAGDIRLSNFMLYQSAYAELYFTKTFWPDFSPKHLNKALNSYAKRNRKFGKLNWGKANDER